MKRIIFNIIKQPIFIFLLFVIFINKKNFVLSLFLFFLLITEGMFVLIKITSELKKK